MKMKKGLIITAAATLLAVSCGKNGAADAKKPWGDFINGAMKMCLSEVLPFVALNEETTYCSFEIDMDAQGTYGEFIIGDDNETNLIEGFVAKLLKKGYEFVEPGEDESFDPYYYKSDEETYGIYVYANYHEATDEFDAGNEIQAYYESSNVSFPTDFKLAQAYYKANGIKNVKIPAFTTEAEELQLSITYSSQYDYLRYDYYGVTREEMDAYAESLEEYGYRYGEAQYAEDYLVKFKKTRAWFEIQDYINYGGAVRFMFYIGAEEFFEFPVDKVVEYLSDKVEVSKNIFPAYPTGDETTFEYDDAYESYYGGVDVYVRGTTHEDCATYLERLQAKGWVLDGQDDEEAWLYYVTGGEYNVLMTIYNVLDSYGYFDIFISAQYVNPEPETTDTFPLDELNEFLEEYDLGLEFTAGFVDASGDGFTYGRIFDDPYHGFRIVVTGNQVSAITTALSPTILAGGYTQFKTTETDNRYRNTDYHEIYITYDSGTDTTFVVFWE